MKKFNNIVSIKINNTSLSIKVNSYKKYFDVEFSLIKNSKNIEFRVKLYYKLICQIAGIISLVLMYFNLV